MVSWRPPHLTELPIGEWVQVIQWTGTSTFSVMAANSMVFCWGLVGLLVWCWGIRRRNETFFEKMLWEHVCRVCWWMLLGGFGCQARHRIGWKSRGDTKNSFCVKAAMLRRRGKIIGQLVWLFRPLLVGTALWRMQSTSDWTQFCHRGHISWYQLMTHATHKIFPTGSESLPVCCKKTTGISSVVTAVPFSFVDSAKDCVLFGRSTTFYVFLQHASSEAWFARDRWMNKQRFNKTFLVG